MLACGDGSLYTGATNDLQRRLARHQSGKGAAYTRSRLPVTLVFHERAKDKSAALRREYALKQLARAQKLQLVADRKGRAGTAGRRAGARRAAGISRAAGR